ncbi:FAD-binding oxidoreductase [Craterilacuibacter sinensis]|uniref:D-lactate dehydrogenase (cytochrome) n=1 Tax=Craterilacuibacter sinensis TaxID=2686017 RepID=A0A845BUT3_9NEIS|nr:FAD-linked oxidase C-terminal domain-containing protein [Craterilacuibacter sinensis]MXR38401.1 FAD-binding protein [Craterilacuibacter sinensis]
MSILSPIQLLQQELAALFADRVSASESIRLHHGHDESCHPDVLPDLVVFPHSTAEVQSVVRLCAKYRIPMIPYGVGSSVEGHTLAIHGGVCIDLSQMNRIVALHEEDLTATVEAGVTRLRLNEELRHSGLFFPIDPGADATLGGMASTRASGTNAVRYGTMRENVLALTAVLPDGEIIHTGTRAKKSSAGYDLTRLLVGAEGTLAIITEVTVRLYGMPEAMSSAMVAFDSVRGAVDSVIQAIQCGIPLARAEMLDALTMAAVNRYSKTDYPECPTLFLEFHGSEASVAEQAQLFADLAEANGGGHFAWSSREEERSRLWQARHNAYFAGLQLKPGCRCIATDVCVPISRLAECIEETYLDLQRDGVEAPLFGHVGDGNFHLMLLANPSDSAEMAKMKAINHRLVQRALAMEGTCSGEHGIGIGKQAYLAQEAGTAALNMMRAIKRSIDPDNLMNPGKIFSL